MSELVEYIKANVLEYLKDVAVSKRMNRNLCIAEKVWTKFTLEEKQELEDFIATECRGEVVHNDFVVEDTVCLVNMRLGAISAYRIFKIDIKEWLNK